MKKSRHEWEAREPEFNKEDFEKDENWFIGIIFAILIVGTLSTFYIVTHI